MTAAGIDIGFTRYKSRQVMTWTLANLRHVGERPSIGSLGRPFEGRTVFVVGAGPSLAGNAARLREHLADGAGGVVVCVNAAARPLAVAGVTPDVVVARESLDLTDQIEATEATVIAADISIHPDTWRAAGDRLAWFIPGYPRQIGLGYMLGEEPIFGGPAALCSAVAIALRWGASRIVLVGCDLAFGSDGTAYHPDAPRGTLRYVQRGEGEDTRIDFTGDSQDDERCERSGQRPPPKSVRGDEVIAFDWSRMLPTISVFSEQRTWLATQADRHGSVVELLNATEGGCGVPGWRSVRLAAVSPAYSVPLAFDMSERVPARRVEDTIEAVRKSCAALEQTSREMLSSRGPDLRVLASIEDAALGAPLGEALSASRLLDVAETVPEARIRAIYTILRDAAGEAQRIVMGRAP